MKPRFFYFPDGDNIEKKGFIPSTPPPAADPSFPGQLGYIPTPPPPPPPPPATTQDSSTIQSPE